MILAMFICLSVSLFVFKITPEVMKRIILKCVMLTGPHQSRKWLNFGKDPTHILYIKILIFQRPSFQCIFKDLYFLVDLTQNIMRGYSCNCIPRRKSGILRIQNGHAAAAAEISFWTR